MKTSDFTFRKKTLLEELNAYKNNKHISLTLYNKALCYLNNGYSFQFYVDTSKKPFKVIKVKKISLT